MLLIKPNETAPCFSSFISPAHLPTLMLMIGFPLFWLEMYVLSHPPGQTTPLSWLLFLGILLFLIVEKRKKKTGFNLGSVGPSRWSTLGRFERTWLLTTGGLVLLILFLGTYASFLPPHLPQEEDALNYHIMLPRQHLILHSFRHIPWSTADLFPLPVQFALAPFWLATDLPNKLPQFIFLLGLIGVCLNLLQRFGRDFFWGSALLIAALAGSRGFTIQMGTAMLDLILAYLFLAALDSLFSGRWILAAVEFIFFFYSKSFIPAQILVTVLILAGLFFLLKKLGGQSSFFAEQTSTRESMSVLKSHLKKAGILFVFGSFLIGGPFLMKSLYYAGTPLYPFFPGLIKTRPVGEDSIKSQSLLRASQDLVHYKDTYGQGRSLKSFLQHWWLVAVPQKGVVNQFDYPLGLPYLLFLGSFFVSLWQRLKNKEAPLMPILAMVFWILWWFSSQQSRFLYIPLLLMFISVTAQIVSPPRVLLVCLLLALGANAFSVFRAHRDDFCKPVSLILRNKDRALLRINEQYFREKRTGPVEMNDADVAFAQFPVDIHREQFPFIIRYE